MVIDSSAVIAILRNEPARHLFLSKIKGDPRRLTSAASFVEMSMVLRGMLNEDVLGPLNAFLRRFEIEVVAFDLEQAITASEAFRRFGKGRHPARLNLGDCITYALAKQANEPLLFKGNDFSKTDLRFS